VGCVPTPRVQDCVCGLSFLYHRYVCRTNQREPSKEPVRQKGCVRDASGVKYVSMAFLCFASVPVVRVWITEGISRTGDVSGQDKLRQERRALPGSSIFSKYKLKSDGLLRKSEKDGIL